MEGGAPGDVDLLVHHFDTGVDGIEVFEIGGRSTVFVSNVQPEVMSWIDVKGEIRFRMKVDAAENSERYSLFRSESDGFLIEEVYHACV